ncbi:DUF924 family protein [Phenylobacterium immobile]|uniref:DUF924 family protein n=1 Tax=Phenylobacterium immobile TaxID=21 RepID=UPI000B221698
MTLSPASVIEVWKDAGPAQWFAKSLSFDQALRAHFEVPHFFAASGGHDDWAETADGALALLILLDQIPRNLFRESGHAFATDGKARKIAREAIAAGHDLSTEPLLRPFFYLPFEHAEDLADQDFGLAAMERGEVDPDTLKWGRLHRDIIVRFGRFPHRNAALGRMTTPEEQAFLDEGGFAG